MSFVAPTWLHVQWKGREPVPCGAALLFPSTVQGDTGSCHREENKVKFLFKTHLLVCYLSHSKGRAANWGQIQQIPDGSFHCCCCCRCPGRGVVPVAALAQSRKGQEKNLRQWRSRFSGRGYQNIFLEICWRVTLNCCVAILCAGVLSLLFQNNIYLSELNLIFCKLSLSFFFCFNLLVFSEK